MKNKRLEQIARLVVDCESRAESPEEYELLHQIYLDVQAHYKQANHKYMRIREFVKRELPDLRIRENEE